jgi:tRNA(His) guanylyltransferase
MDALGDRMKMYEGMETGRVGMPRLPLMIRIDGKGFSNWTRGLRYPFDERLQALRVEVTKRLVEALGARAGYCQSDEISLALWAEDEKSSLYCGGNLQKIVSHSASMATAFWNLLVPIYLPEKAGLPAMFDARAWNVPSLEEATNVFLWREQDATKNSVSMAARSVYSHKEILGKTSSEMQEMLFIKGINWNDYPSWAKRGTYLGRRTLKRVLTVEEIESLPARNDARRNPNMMISRSGVVVIDLPPLAKIQNKVDVLFKGALERCEPVNAV